MLYELTIEESGAYEPRFQSFVFEAPEYTMQADGPAVNTTTQEWCYKRVHEASVMWDFAEVHVVLARYFPARIGFAGETDNSCVTSVIRSWDDAVDKVVSR